MGREYSGYLCRNDNDMPKGGTETNAIKIMKNAVRMLKTIRLQDSATGEVFNMYIKTSSIPKTGVELI